MRTNAFPPLGPNIITACMCLLGFPPQKVPFFLFEFLNSNFFLKKNRNGKERGGRGNVGRSFNARKEKERKRILFSLKVGEVHFHHKKRKFQSRSYPPSFPPPSPNIALKLGFNCEFSSLFCLVFPLPSFVVCASHSWHTHTRRFRGAGIPTYFLKKN